MSDYHEPWNCTLVTRDTESAEHRQEYLIWGNQIWNSAVTMDLLGNTVEMDGRGIIAHVRPSWTKDGPLDAKEYADRITRCVNFCAGIANDSLPERGLRQLLDKIQESMVKNHRDSLNENWRPRRTATDEIG